MVLRYDENKNHLTSSGDSQNSKTENNIKLQMKQMWV